MGIGTAQWGYVLEAPGRPPLKVQRQFMHSVGLDMTKFGPIWHDRVEKSSTRPQNQASVLGLTWRWLNYHRMYWTIRFRFWRAKRKYGPKV